MKFDSPRKNVDFLDREYCSSPSRVFPCEIHSYNFHSAPMCSLKATRHCLKRCLLVDAREVEFHGGRVYDKDCSVEVRVERLELLVVSSKRKDDCPEISIGYFLS